MYIIMCTQLCDDKTQLTTFMYLLFLTAPKEKLCKSISFGYYGVHVQRDNDISIFIHHCKYITINVLYL